MIDRMAEWAEDILSSSLSWILPGVPGLTAVVLPVAAIIIVTSPAHILGKITLVTLLMIVEFFALCLLLIVIKEIRDGTL